MLDDLLPAVFNGLRLLFACLLMRLHVSADPKAGYYLPLKAGEHHVT